ncbi:MAG: hypothetical protein ACR2O1_07440 [Boseongicola sp.]
MKDRDRLPPLWLGLFRLALRILVIVIAVFAIHLIMNWATERAEAAGRDGLMLGVLTALLLAYAVLIAIPFMPGIEIGISLLILKGASIAPLVYAATVLGLSLALLAGRFTPYRWLHGLLADLRLRRASNLVERLAPMSREERLEHLAGRAPSWLRPFVRTGRYLVLAILFNVPGNSVIGGGGGIAFIAGFSRLFRPGIAILVIALAVPWVPLIVWIYGTDTLFAWIFGTDTLQAR